jgi:hypothetical protein
MFGISPGFRWLSVAAGLLGLIIALNGSPIIMDTFDPKRPKAGSVADKFRITRCGPMGGPVQPRFFSSYCATEVAAHSSIDLVVFDLDNVLARLPLGAPTDWD